ncbi:efflux RND transporter permease subunit [Desulfosediminicola sp.]|uniref:efflux RND transporter permease subunit n=1 Tax=Desulfosediminicola sp. TaxID=2886825 RepID=UPI003AF2DA7E
MQNLVRFTLRQKVVLNLLFVLLIVIGAFVLLRMPAERYPNIEFGKMYINTFLPGASPEDVEKLITNEIEEALENVEDLDYIQSVSYRERSNVVIKFVDDSDYRRRFDSVRLEVLSILEDLPALPEPPVFNFLDVNDWFPTISVNISGKHSNTTLSLVAEELKIPLAQIKGVKEVKLTGDFTREFHILLSPTKMRRFGLTFNEVARSLELANINLPAGHAKTEYGEFIVRVDEQFRTRDDIFTAIIRTDSDGSFIRIGDVADQGYFSYRDPFIIASVNGVECVTLQIIKEDRGNALFIARDVRDIVKKLNTTYRAEKIILTVTQDSSSKIKDSIRVLGVNLLLGVALVFLIIWQFMGMRNGILTTIGIPFAFVVTMVFMYLTGNSINEVSLFAFVLVSGIIVDDAIVVVENIYRHVQLGKDVVEAITIGTSEVFLPVVSATLTTGVAFLPMLIMTGMVGDFFAIIPKTIVFALIASLLECLFILPCHYLDFGPRKAQSSKKPTKSVTELAGYLESVREGRTMTVIRRFFNWLIELVLRLPYISITLLALIFAAALAIFHSSMTGATNMIRIQFFPDNYALYYVEVTAPSGTPIGETDELLKELAKAVMAEGEEMHESALGFAGFIINEDYSPRYGNNLGHLAVTLPDSNKRRFTDYPENDVVLHLDYMREKLAGIVPLNTTLSIRPEKDGPPAGKDVNIRVLGTDGENVATLAAHLLDFLKNHNDFEPWLLDLQNDQGASGRVFTIRVNRERVAEWGLQIAEVARLAASVLNGRIVGEMKLAEEIIDIKLKMALGTETSQMTQALEASIIDLPGGTIRLSDLATPVYSLEPGYLNRFQAQRAITLTANIKPGAPISAAMIVNKVQDYYLQIRENYPGASLNFSGEHESTRESFISLTYAFGIAILLIYLILSAQFHSYLQPLIIVSAVVFALIGVIYGTLFSRTLFTVNSFVAVVGVTGVVVNDSLVLVEFLNSCYRRGQNRHEALMLATNIRLRPILLTTLTTTLGLLPMALGIPEYSIIWGSMAMTFVTGLCTATFLTIIIVPILWDILVQLEKTPGHMPPLSSTSSPDTSR